MINDEAEEPIAVGTWLYAGTVKCYVHLVRRNIAYGTGDHEDPVYVREDREGEFYYLKFSDPTNPRLFNGQSGAFESIEDAKRDAERTCPDLVWDSG